MNINGDLVVIGKIRQGKLDSGNVAVGQFSHVEGSGSTAQGDFTFVHGVDSVALGNNTVVFGDNITGSSDNTMYISKLNIATQPVSATSNYDVLVRDNTTGEIKIGTGGGGGTYGTQVLTYRSSGITGPAEFISSIPGVSHPVQDLGYYIDNNTSVVKMNFTILNATTTITLSAITIGIEFRVQESNTSTAPDLTAGNVVHTENIVVAAYPNPVFNYTVTPSLNVDLSAYAGKHLTLSVASFNPWGAIFDNVLVRVYIQ